jgi:DNA modification methylase
MSDNRSILYFLNNLGFLPKDFNGDLLTPYLQNNNSKIRYLAVKNIGKIKNKKYSDVLFDLAFNDPDSTVRREAVSSIGRMRSRDNIPKLIILLKDRDPKVSLQAIRALLLFKDDKKVEKNLKYLKDHPNETIQSVIEKEYSELSNKTISILPHDETYDFIKNVVVNTDVLEALKFVPDDAVHLTFTSPPYYNARDYSIYPSYQAYLDFLAQVFEEVHRVTKEGRFFILNTSPIIIPRVSRQHSSKRYPITFDIHPYLIKMGWEFIDDIIWAKPEASVKNRNAGFLQHRKPLAYKPNPTTEYLLVYRKKTPKLIDWNIKQYDENTIEDSKVSDEYETKNIWYIDPVFDKVHSAVFPYELCYRVIKYYSFKGDLIFDPFAGSGTLGKAAVNMNRFLFLTEKDKKYFERIKSNLKDSTFFIEIKYLTLDQFEEEAKI